jgi:hypothetical protein
MEAVAGEAITQGLDVHPFGADEALRTLEEVLHARGRPLERGGHVRSGSRGRALLGARHGGRADQEQRRGAERGK